MEALSTPIHSPTDLEKSILSYNRSGRWNFDGLYEYFQDHVDDDVEHKIFFDKILPEMIRMCLKSSILVTRPIPLLKQTMNHSLTFSQSQIASLLACAFFCTFPRRNATGKDAEYSSFPDINFTKLFSSLSTDYQPEKFKCILNYFRRISEKTDTEETLVTFQRRCIRRQDLPKWYSSDKKLCQFHVTSQGNIEDDGQGLLQVWMRSVPL